MQSLVIPYGMWDQVQEFLFQADGAEGFAMCLARPCRRAKGTAYIVEHLVEQAGTRYEHRSKSGLMLSDADSTRFNQISVAAAKLGLVPVHLHSHPPGVSDFSPYDDAHELKLHGWLQSMGQPFLWSLVCPYGGEPIARMWHGGAAHSAQLRTGLRVRTSTSQPGPSGLERQLAFGPGLRAAASTLRVGIVGVGGIGFLVAEQLVRCGFRNFVLVDPDRLDRTNMNRIPGAHRGDIQRLKVFVARRLIRQAAQSLGIEAQVQALPHDVYVAGPRIRRVLRTCDLILALTDDELSRIACLQLALEAGAEYLQAGVDVRLDSGGSVSGMYAEVTGAEVNRYCPLCTGRLNAAQASVEARRYLGGEAWERAVKEGYVQEVEAPSVMSLNSVAAGLLVSEIQRRVSGLGVRDLFQLDVQTASLVAFERVDEHLLSDCDVCGRRRPLVRENAA
jgi:hypothetical protein